MPSKKLLKLLLILVSVYGSLYFLDKSDPKIIEKTLLITTLVTLVNFMHPTL